MSRSWSSAHDWKSCRGQKLLESSNLSISATSLRTTYRSQRLFAKVTSHSFCRSSSPNRTRLRWASIRFFITALGIFLLTFPMPEQSPLCFDAFLYLRLKIRLASLPCFSFPRRIPRMCLGGLFKLRIACDDDFSFRTIVIAHSLRCSLLSKLNPLTLGFNFVFILPGHLSCQSLPRHCGRHVVRS